MNAKTIRETDLYPPVKRYLESLEYEVKGEVNDCDVVAVRGEDVIVIELKRHFSNTVLIQAIERQALTDSVYIAVPRPCGGGMKGKWKGVRRLLRRLELGLLFISGEKGIPDVAVALHPAPHTKRRNSRGRRALLEEFHARSGDYNAGGSTGRPLITAYREQAVRIAHHLSANGGVMSPRDLRALGTSKNTTQILYRNVYGWFAHEARGTYALTDQGRRELQTYSGLTENYCN